MNKVFQIFLYVLMLLLPAGGLTLIKRRSLLALAVALWALSVFLLVMSRLITTSLGFALAFFSPGIVIPVSLYTITTTAIHMEIIGWRKLRDSLLLSLGFSVVLLGLFYYRDPLLGINLFYIPSESMQPTLLPGDIVIVDTRHYRYSAPQIGEVVVFYRLEGQLTYVKRITDVSIQQFSVAGDNPLKSVSSKKIGAIPFDRLRGKVTAILFNANFPITDTSRLLKNISAPR